MTPPAKPEPLETRSIEPARPKRPHSKIGRARKGWKGRRTPLRSCNAPGDEMWREQGAGE